MGLDLVLFSLSRGSEELKWFAQGYTPSEHNTKNPVQDFSQKKINK